MKNYDHYEKKLTEIFRSGRQFGVNKSTGEPIACDFLPCQNCAFNEIKVGCTECRADWMDKEEEPELPRRSVTNDETIMEAINYAADKCRLVEPCDECPYMATSKFPNCRTLYIMDHLLNQGLIDITTTEWKYTDEDSIELHTTDGRVEQLTLSCNEDDEHFVE